MSFGESYQMVDLDLILDIKMKNNVNKENINVQIKKLINGVVNGDLFAYETNVTQISPLISKLEFIFQISHEIEEAQCAFKKYKDNKPLLLLCLFRSRSISSGDYTLKEIEQEKKLEDINSKYNFIISPVKSEEIINYESGSYPDGGAAIYSIIPSLLDFTKKESYKTVIWRFWKCTNILN